MNRKYTFRAKAFFPTIFCFYFLSFSLTQLSAQGCPSITDSISIRQNVTCVSGNNGVFQFVGKGGVAPYTYTLSTISGDVTNATGLFENLVAKDYRIKITDANGCIGTNVRTIESFTDFSTLNNSMLSYDWLADSIPSSESNTYTYLTGATPAFKVNGDSLAKYNAGNTNGISKFIPIGFSFKMDNFYYDSLVIAEDGIVSFNRNINLIDISSQWFENTMYTGLNTYTNPAVGDCQCDTAYLNNPLPFIAPLRDDLQTNSSGDVPSQIIYKLSGTAPNRVFTVEWRNMRWNRVCNVQRDNSVSFQIELFEGTNNVKFHYKAEPNLKTDNCGGTPLGNFASVTGYNYSAGLFGRRLGGGNYIALNPDSTKLFTNAPNVVTDANGTTLYRGVKTDNLNFPSAIGYPYGKHYQFISPSTGTCTASLSIVSLQATPSSGSNGMITITATGGLPKIGTPTSDKRYYYSKDGGKTYRLGSMPATGTVYQDTFKDLAPGTYRIAVQDNQTYGIPGNASPNFQSFIIQTVVVPNIKVDSLIVQPITCGGGNDGQLRFTWQQTSPMGTYNVHFEKEDGTGAQDLTNTNLLTKLYTGLSAGLYRITVTFNDYGTSTTVTETLVNPAVLTYTPVVTQPVCPSNATTGNKVGSVILTAAGGVPNSSSTYTFTAPAGLTASSSTNTTRTFTNLATGTYIFTVTDSRGCTKTASVTIANPSNYAVNITSTTNPKCNGSSDGAIALNVTGGSAATFNTIVLGSTTYSTITKGVDITKTGLAAGSYSVSVTEGTCAFNQSAAVTLLAPTNLTFTSSTPTATSCSSGTDGQLVLFVSGATSPYMYSINNGTSYQNSNTFTGLSAGSYTLKAKDANGCFSVTTPSVTVSSPTAVTILSIAKNNVLCKGASTGLIQAIGAGGSGMFQYSKDGGTNFQTSNQFTNLPAGTGVYSIKIKDSKGCLSASQNVDITEPATNVSFTTTKTDITCATTTGSITVTGSGGTGTLQFSSNNGTNYTTGTPTNPYTFSGLAAATYPIKVKDANNCVATAANVVISGAASPNIAISNQVNVVCNGTSSGSFTATISGGTTPYTVVLRNASNTSIAGTGSNPYNYNNLPAGTYTVSVTDGGTCTKTQSVTITQSATFALVETAKTNATCGNNNGSITFNITGGTATYSTTSVSGGSLTSPTIFNGGASGTSRTITNLGSGVYSVVITDINNCTATLNFAIAGTSDIAINSVTPTHPLCHGGTGQLMINASGGTAPLSYSINGIDFVSGSTFTGLNPNNYTVTVKDNVGCTEVQNTAITEPTAINLSITKTEPLCNGGTGSITVTASGGTGTLSFSNDNGANYTSGTSPFIFNSLAAGATYQIKVKDINACETATTNITINQPTPLSIASTSKLNASCFSGNDGSITVNASGGTGALSFSNDNGATYIVGTSPFQFTELTAANYQIKVKDENACETNPTSVIIAQPNQVVVSLVQKTDIKCNGDATGVINVEATGGRIPSNFYHFTITNGSVSNTNGLFTGLTAGTYTITATDDFGCEGILDVTLTEPNAPLSIGSILTTVATCATGGKVTIAGTTGGTSPYTFKLSSFSNTDGHFTNMAAGSYTLTVTDNNGCAKTKDITVNGSEVPVILVSSQTNITCKSATTGSFELSISGGTGAYTVIVKNASNNTLTGTGSNPYVYTNLAAGIYSISVIDDASCTVTASVNLTEPTTLLTPAIEATTTAGCTAAFNGTAMLSATGGVSPYTFELHGMNNATGRFTNLVAGNYTATVTDNVGCEKNIIVDILSSPTVTNISETHTDITCNNANDGTISWIATGGTAPFSYTITNGTTNTTGVFTGLSAGNYNITYSDSKGCTLAGTPPSVTIVNPLPLSISTTKQDVSINGSADGKITVTASGGTGALQFSKDGGATYTTGTSPFDFTGLAVGTYIIKVKDVNNCPATTTSVSITEPNVLSFATQTTDASCNGSATGTIKVAASGGVAPYVFSKDNGTNYTSFPNPYTFTGLAANIYKIRVKDANGAETVASNIIVGEASAISFTTAKTDATCLQANGTATVSASGGTGSKTIVCDICPTAAVSGVYSGLSANTYVFTATDASNCTKTTSVTINNIGAIPTPPDAIANRTVCKNTIVTITPTGGTNYKFYGLNPTLGNVTPLSTGTFYGFTAIANTTIWVTKIIGNCESAPITAIVSTDDITPPTASCKAVTIQLNDAGTATLTATQVDNGSTDNCLLQEVSINKTNFNCSNLGTNTIIFTATDAAGNTATCTATVTVEDKIAPSVLCKPVTIQLNATGNTTLTTLQVDNNLSSDNCGIASRTLSKTNYNCTNLGINTVLFTTTDASGNSANCTTTVLVEDNIPPSVSCKSVTIQLDATGNATLTATQVDNNSTDNCSITSRNISKASFNCLNVGTNTVIFTATDVAGNTATCSTTIIVEDKIAPSVSCKPVTIQLNATGNATLTTAQVNNNSTDNCGINSMSLSKTSFNCSNLGTNTVIFTATDGSGNSATCTTTITVVDKIAPTIHCPANMTLQFGSGECQKAVTFGATATDNCTTSPIVTQTAGLHSGDLFGIGTYNVGFKATDASLNTSFCSFSITINENTADGTMACIGLVNVTIDSNCTTRFLPEFILVGAHYGCFDNYSVKLLTLSGTVLPNDYLSSNQIGATLRAVVSDRLGNSCSGLFKVLDSTPPTIQAPPAKVITCDQIGTNGVPLSSISGEPSVVKECSLPTTMYYNDNIIDVNCGVSLTAPPVGFPADMPFDIISAQGARRIIVRTFYVSDRYNNRASTRQVIYIKANLLNEVSLTSNLDLSCGNVRTEPKDTVINGIRVAGTGYPTLLGNINLSETFCPITVTYTDVRQVTATGYTIRRNWIVANACFSFTRNWVQTINVRDLPPTMVLKPNVVVQIPTARRVDILANDLISTLADDCTSRANMVLGIRKVGTGTGFPTTSSLSFACGDQGTYTVEIWVRDQGGNILTQTAPLSIKDDVGNCVLPSIAGIIQRENGTDVPAKTMLYDAANVPTDSMTGNSYYFNGLSPNNHFRVMPTRPNTDWINGVTMFDVALLSRHVLGVEALSTPYRLIGADVNRSGDVDAVDMLLMQRLILRTIPTLPNNNSWRFVLKNYVFSDPTDPFASDFPEILSILNLTTAITNGDFVAIKVGDVNLSAGSVIIRGSLPSFILSAEDKFLEKNKTYQIPIKIMPFQKDYNGQNLSALQFALNIDKNTALVDHIEQGDLPNWNENNIGLFKNDGIVTAAWYRSPQQKFVENDTFTIFNLTIKPTVNARLSDILSINPTYTEGVAYDEKGISAAVKLSFDNNFKETSKALLLPNHPNPFSEETTISFVLPEAGNAKLTVCDLMGKVLMQTEKTFSKGLNEVLFNTQTPPSVSSGVLVVRLQTGKSVIEQKIVFSH